MSQFQKYRRTQIAEMADWEPGFDMTRVSVSDADKEAGSPKLGDKIARNPANHADRWLVAADYFAVNFEPMTAAPVSPWQGMDGLREIAMSAVGTGILGIHNGRPAYYLQVSAFEKLREALK